jgi:hypothetical protein
MTPTLQLRRRSGAGRGRAGGGCGTRARGGAPAGRLATALLRRPSTRIPGPRCAPAPSEIARGRGWRANAKAKTSPRARLPRSRRAARRARRAHPGRGSAPFARCRPSGPDVQVHLGLGNAPLGAQPHIGRHTAPGGRVFAFAQSGGSAGPGARPHPVILLAAFFDGGIEGSEASRRVSWRSRAEADSRVRGAVEHSALLSLPLAEHVLQRSGIDRFVEPGIHLRHVPRQDSRSDCVRDCAESPLQDAHQ